MTKYHGDIGMVSRPLYRADTSRQMAIELVLLFFLGGLGAHRFYMGRTTSGLILLSLTCFGVIFGAIVGGIKLALLVVGVILVWLVMDFFLILASHR
ncbi:NINE protein [Novosphingobium album (ex Liu et al. 2023)]|uniref:NINE protein n=1 Tax=Novosphingobium album (ex Liu et al. 2023) TaxID=3031130 RepID=A0ABT5WUW2_9SPHN|nr:NINE protein [Novosphingobium album (ex Liu et al. 2023)]MDE8653657.1 NINE protein [Novosphingobium album (ex Liu et al. 2023)]